MTIKHSENIRALSEFARSESASTAQQQAAKPTGFRNAQATFSPGLLENLAILRRFLFDKPEHARPAGSIPVQELSRAELLAAPNQTGYRLGHSTLLFKLQNQFFLTDPVFSERASPLALAGPKRFHDTPLSIEELPELAAIILSHDHYDHLDRAAIRALHQKTRLFLCPLGVGQHLRNWGVGAEKIIELNWWQSHQLGDLRFSATPAQHFSGRGLRDHNQTLWCSWVIQDQQTHLFFSGDTGYFPGFKEIAARFKYFDLSFIETGAYDKAWPDVHMLPEQSLQAHLDLNARYMMPIHNSTFDLGLHNWFEPLDRISALAAQRQVMLSTPIIGAAFDLTEPQRGTAWWQSPQVRGF